MPREYINVKLYEKEILSLRAQGLSLKANLVLSTIRAAKRKEKITADLQHHSDQGFQYTSQAYFNLAQSYGITP